MWLYCLTAVAQTVISAFCCSLLLAHHLQLSTHYQHSLFCPQGWGKWSHAKLHSRLSEPQGIQVLSREGEALEVYWQVALPKDKALAKRRRLSQHCLVPDQLFLGCASTVPLSPSRHKGSTTSSRISFPLLLNDLTQQFKGIWNIYILFFIQSVHILPNYWSIPISILTSFS